MANMCFGSLSIVCNEELLADIRSFVKNGDKLLDLNKIVPINDAAAAYESWGTSRNVDEEYETNTGFCFLTAWSPCSHAVEALAKRFPEAAFRYVYDESSMGFCGAEVYENGQLVYSLDADYHETFDDDEEDPEGEPFISTDILPVSGNVIDVKFIPTSQDGDWTIGQIYYREQVDEYWGRQFKGDVKFKGAQPVEWF